MTVWLLYAEIRLSLSAPAIHRVIWSAAFNLTPLRTSLPPFPCSSFALILFPYPHRIPWYLAMVLVGPLMISVLVSPASGISYSFNGLLFYHISFLSSTKLALGQCWLQSIGCLTCERQCTVTQLQIIFRVVLFGKVLISVCPLNLLQSGAVSLNQCTLNFQNPTVPGPFPTPSLSHNTPLFSKLARAHVLCAPFSNNYLLKLLLKHTQILNF